MAWSIDHNDVYDIFPDIILYFPMYQNESMQFGVKLPPQVSHVILILALDTARVSYYVYCGVLCSS